MVRTTKKTKFIHSQYYNILLGRVYCPLGTRTRFKCTWVLTFMADICLNIYIYTIYRVFRHISRSGLYNFHIDIGCWTRKVLICRFELDFCSFTEVYKYVTSLYIVLYFNRARLKKKIITNPLITIDTSAQENDKVLTIFLFFCVSDIILLYV